MYPISFGSDNHSGVHPTVIDSMISANDGFCFGYGDDPLTLSVIDDIKKMFGGKCECWFALTGTGANVLALQSLMNSFHSVICANTAHINVDECGAVQKFTQARLVALDVPDGKLRAESILPLMHDRGDQHHSQKRIISISQSTEYGTLYSLDELRALADFAHTHGMYLHIDGARLANAAVALGVSMQAMTYDIGADIISFGGTKNGLMFGEAIISFRPELTSDIIYYRKQASQLYSKMRYISAQFQAYLKDDLWRSNAEHANRMAKLFATKLSGIPGVTITQNVEVNALFAILPRAIIAPLQEKYLFYVWNEERHEVRLMCSFNTTEEQLDAFVTDLRAMLS